MLCTIYTHGLYFLDCVLRLKTEKNNSEAKIITRVPQEARVKSSYKKRVYIEFSEEVRFSLIPIFGAPFPPKKTESESSWVGVIFSLRENKMATGFCGYCVEDGSHFVDVQVSVTPQ